MIDDIKLTIEKALPESTVYVLDPMNDNTHFESIVISEKFNNLTLVRQHQLVMNALSEKFATTVHALGLKTFTPEKWQNEKHKYNIEN